MTSNGGTRFRGRGPKFKLTRDALIFYTGWAGIIHQTLISDTDRISLLILFGSMIGIPTALGLDEWRRGKDDSQQPPTDTR